MWILEFRFKLQEFVYSKNTTKEEVKIIISIIIIIQI